MIGSRRAHALGVMVLCALSLFVFTSSAPADVSTATPTLIATAPAPSSAGSSEHASPATGAGVTAPTPAGNPHASFATDEFPSAVKCASCHQRIFTEWSSSSHAYASVSPMFHKFEQAISTLASGTIGTFCVRCHQQVGTQMGEAREAALWQRSPIAREGITCITCHRVSTEFARVNGERHIAPGPVTDPVVGMGDTEHLFDVIGNADHYRVATEDPNPSSARPVAPQDRTPIHGGVVRFRTIAQSEFCVSCHQVAVHPGIKLEVVWEQYRASPASRAGVTCQNCHMGRVPGRNDGYETWPTAIVNGEAIGNPNARHSNHAFFGPGYSIAHPGIFPFNPRSLRWPIDQWLTFDYRAAWGEPAFEDRIASGAATATFPSAWAARADRESARMVVDQNQRLLERKKLERIAIMENGMRIDGPLFRSPPRRGRDLSFNYRINNTDDGHNLPSGSLGAQPELWLNVALIDPDGKRVWESGYVDQYGDMADLHSRDVRAGLLPHDEQLFNLQTKFLTTNVKGTDREMYLPINFDIDQRPFIRPAGVPSTVLNHPPFIRMEQRSIAPLSHRDASYRIPANLLTKPGAYRLQSRMRSRAEPMYFMNFVGATTEMERHMNEWTIDIHPSAVSFNVE